MLWLSVISEFTYIGLLGMGFLLMWLEVLCSHKEMHSLKINAYAAICTVLSGEMLRCLDVGFSLIQPTTVCMLPRLANWFVWLIARRSSRDGGSHDVHHSVSDDSYCWTQRLAASVLGLRLVICVGGCKPASVRHVYKMYYCLQNILTRLYLVV